jgi:flavin-dependent dehydrogenase
MIANYDVIVVGARCAGAPTAMLLARQGHRVLLVDQAVFPSDTLSTLMVHAPGIAALRRWGLLDQVIASGCPPIDSYSFDFGPVSVAGTPHPVDGSSTAYAPRRTVLDKILVEAAVAAGAELRERFSVDDILLEDGVAVGIRGRDANGNSVEERARIVIGADGRNSHVARAVQPEQYQDRAKQQWSYYTYFSGLPVDGFEIFVRPDRGWAAIPTNDDLTLVVIGWPFSEASAYKADIETNFLKTLELAPAFAERVSKATRVEQFSGGAVAGFFRKPYGKGWALVGDAGYSKDPITAQGISDAFRDAEACSSAINSAFTGAASYDDAMAAYQLARDSKVMPLYEFTTQLASLEPPSPEVQHLVGAMQGNAKAMDAFVSITSGTLSPAEFFDPAYLGPLLGAATT